MTVLYQDIRNSSCCHDLGDGFPALGAWAAGSAVADVFDAGCGSGVLSKDFAL